MFNASLFGVSGDSSGYKR